MTKAARRHADLWHHVFLVLACLARRYLTQALVVYERLGILIEPEQVRKELVDLG